MDKLSKEFSKMGIKKRRSPKKKSRKRIKVLTTTSKEPKWVKKRQTKRSWAQAAQEARNKKVKQKKVDKLRKRRSGNVKNLTKLFAKIDTKDKHKFNRRSPIRRFNRKIYKQSLPSPNYQLFFTKKSSIIFANKLKKYFPKTFVWPEYLHITLNLPLVSKEKLSKSRYNVNKRKALLKSIIKEAGSLVWDKKKNKYVLVYPSLYRVCDYYYNNLKNKVVILGNFEKNYNQDILFVNINNIKPNKYIPSPHITISKDKYGSKSVFPPKNIFKNMKLQLAGVRISQKGIGKRDEFHIACTLDKLPHLSALLYFNMNKAALRFRRRSPRKKSRHRRKSPKKTRKKRRKK